MLATMCPDIVFARLPVILTCGIVTALLGFILIKIEFHSHPLSVGSHAKKGIGYPMRVLISIVPSYTTKKAHTIKNLVLGGLHTRKVNYLSQTYAGKRHDKKIADEESPTYPEDISLYKDTGFQGYEPEGVKTFQPQKKPKGKELTSEQKEQNSLISSIRIVIEHIISGMKRCRIVKDLFRNTKAKYDDLVMEIACALHNFRVYCRKS